MFVHMFALYVGGGGHSRISELSGLGAKKPCNCDVQCDHRGNFPVS